MTCVGDGEEVSAVGTTRRAPIPPKIMPERLGKARAYPDTYW